MHNWGFLLLAFVAVFQPIASFEPGVVDGRQRCDYRTVFRDPAVHFHGTYRFTKPLDRRLNQREDVRDIRRNEVREESLRTSFPERWFVDTIENRGSSPTRLVRSSRADNRLAGDAIHLQRETRGAERRTEYRTERSHEVEPKDLPSVRQTRLDSRYSNKLAEDENRASSRRVSVSREPMQSRRDTRRNQDTTEWQQGQIRVTRIASNRARDDVSASSRKERRIARDRVQMNTRRSELRAQQALNADHRVPERRSRNIEFRSSSVSSARAYNNEDSRLARQDDTQSLEHDQRRNMPFRRTLDGQNRQRDSKITHRDTVLSEQRIRDSDRTRDVRNLQSEHKFEPALNSRQTDALPLGHERFVENRNAAKTRDFRLTRAAQEYRISQDLRTDSRISKRERTAENRREARDTRVTRSMERNVRSVDRAAENLRDSRLADRERITENRREIENTARKSRTVMQNRAVDNKRNVRSTERDSREIRAESKITRNSCSSNREGSTELRMASRDVERVVARILPMERDAVNQRNTLSIERASRLFGLERNADNRNIHRESRILGRDQRTQSQRNIRMNFREVRSADRERALESQRNNRIIQTARLEQMDRRDAHNFERLLTADRRDTRNKLDARTFEQKQSSEARDKRNIRDSRPFTREMSQEVRQDIRNVNERDTRTTERNSRSIRRERSSESRRDIRNIDELPETFLFEQRRERLQENCKEMRNERNSRTFRSEERRVESRVTNMARARDSHSTERRNVRVLQRLNIRDNRHNPSVSRESRPESERMSRRSLELERRESRNRLNTEIARKREFLSMMQNPTLTENETSTMNWQYLFYTLQGLYICGLLTQLINEKNAGKKTRALSWWSAPQHLIKVD